MWYQYSWYILKKDTTIADTSPTISINVGGTFYRFNTIYGGTLFSEKMPSTVVLFLKAIPAILIPFYEVPL